MVVRKGPRSNEIWFDTEKFTKFDVLNNRGYTVSPSIISRIRKKAKAGQNLVVSKENAEIIADDLKQVKDWKFFEVTQPEPGTAGDAIPSAKSLEPSPALERPDILPDLKSSRLARQAMVRPEVLKDVQQSCQETPDALADELMRLIETDKVPTALRWLHLAHSYLNNETRQKRAEPNGAMEAQAALLKIAFSIAPYGYGCSKSFPIPADERTGRPPVWGLQVTMETVAEIIIASLHNRSVSFSPKLHENHRPSGDLKLTMPPEAGDEDVGDLRKRLLTMLYGAFTPAETEGVREAIWLFLDYQFAGRAVPREADGTQGRAVEGLAAKDTRAERIKRWREQEVNDRKKYLLFPKQETPEGRTALEAMLREISEKVGGLHCIGVYGDDEVELQEIPIVGPLTGMLPVVPRSPKEGN